ncbi:MAG: TIGR00282 family metallophosphoesterase [Armatimonadetes bacterium CG_4_10_14_3_um_filter_66_18]|nr:TIGR00282 family metallophosphoesterase [Armatimonadota bacterium]OIP04521.1 MAG: metallophosphoesterase [Armatimonadetes bacterium CG2_30_66_41]PIU94711.1 MAG: TIGR00282 family metallophosphoesterase [Armatimonadetes bacterium CG06_land_8_20_14_3_00_66_21]PIX49627.1 MAG: TIGR00282 family metallophosphoesterase [Armatimonadetes bacterium CG_4_8_14_3_um_filter_66_20]PIY48027.1 MAG: TIGR00282 family metallophosphoesterase [Armatimonadetes bacterium CG_4_10_14_3_um_filter_66_18]PIZ48937.1 MAG:
MHILMIGDVVGRPGRKVTTDLLPDLRTELGADLVIANGENAAGGMGISAQAAEQLFDAGVDVLTLGNHTYRQKEAVGFLDECPLVVRPANYPPGAPGRGATVVTTASAENVAVINLMGRTFMDAIDCPFRAADRELKVASREATIVIVDMHAEATSEKLAMAYYLDGRVSAVLGTHTHVPTADERVFPGGAAYVTDCGMTGPTDSILGVRSELIVQRFLTGVPTKFQIAGGPAVLSGVLVEVEDRTGRAVGIRRVTRTANAGNATADPE